MSGMEPRKQTRHRMIVAYKADELNRSIAGFLAGLTEEDRVVSTQLTHTILPPEITTNFRSVFTYIIVYEHTAIF